MVKAKTVSSSASIATESRTVHHSSSPSSALLVSLRPFQEAYSVERTTMTHAISSYGGKHPPRERGLGVGLGRDSRYGSIYVCPPPPRDPRALVLPPSSLPLPFSPRDPTPSTRPTGRWRGTQGPPGASSAGQTPDWAARSAIWGASSGVLGGTTDYRPLALQHRTLQTPNWLRFCAWKPNPNHSPIETRQTSMYPQTP